MTNQKDVKKLSSFIFSASLTNGKISEVKLKKSIEILKKTAPRKAVPVLKRLNKLIEQKESEDQLQVESPYSLGLNSEKLIEAKFEKMLSKKLNLKFIENKDLIAGIRIRNADYIWENSVKDNLEQIRQNLIND